MFYLTNLISSDYDVYGICSQFLVLRQPPSYLARCFPLCADILRDSLIIFDNIPNQEYRRNDAVVTDILNYIKINDKLSTTGQPSPDQFNVIADAGFTSVINLAMPDSTNALPDEGGFVSEQGMNYFHIPVSFEAPTIEHLHLFLNLLRILEGNKVWIHCALNWRVSAFMYHYQTSVLKLSDAEIVPLLKSWEPDEIWLNFLKLDLVD